MTSIGFGESDSQSRLPLRNADKSMRDQFVRWYKDAGSAVFVGLACRFKFDSELLNPAPSVAKDLNISRKNMFGAASSVSRPIATPLRTALIFTPCNNGTTHNKNEHIEREYTVPSVNIPLHSV